MLNSNTWNYLTVCKQKSSNSFKNKIIHLKSYMIYMYKQDLPLNNHQNPNIT